jgi:double-stranded uracil-DNA glycosylase
MIETHPFKPFVPQGAKYLLLGSFPGRLESRAGEWYYETKRGQFWNILQEVYSVKLNTRQEKTALLTKLHIALSDTIYKCERIKGNNSDKNLKVIEYNIQTVLKILSDNNVERIYFSSRNVEKIFKSKFKDILKIFPNIELVTLPSSSPRHAALSLSQKIKVFKKILPGL